MLPWRWSGVGGTYSSKNKKIINEARVATTAAMSTAPTAESRRGAAARVVLLQQHPKPISSTSSHAPRISANCSSSSVVPRNLRTAARIRSRRLLLAAAARRGSVAGPWSSTLGRRAAGAAAAAGGMHESWIMDVIRGLYCLLNVSLNFHFSNFFIPFYIYRYYFFLNIASLKILNCA